MDFGKNMYFCRRNQKQVKMEEKTKRNTSYSRAKKVENVLANSQVQSARERIDALMKIGEYDTLEAFAADIGMPVATVKRWIKHNAIPSRSVNVLCEVFPGVNKGWLTTGVKCSDVSDNTLMRAAAYNRSRLLRDPLRKVQIVENMAATCGDVDRTDSYESYITVELPVRPNVRFLVRCEGESMEPRIYDGDYVGIGDEMTMFDRFEKGKMYLLVTRYCTMVKMVEDPGVHESYLQLSTFNENYVLSDGGRLPKEELLKAYKVNMVMNFE